MSENHLRLEVEKEGGPKRGQAAPERRTSLRLAGYPQKWRGKSHFSQRLRAGWLRKVQAVQLH